MDTQILPATAERFDDVETMLGPKRGPDAIACWCLTYRLGSRASGKLDAAARMAAVHDLCSHSPSPGILAYLEDEVVGWASVAPRSQVAELADPTTYPRVDDVEPWSIFCLRTRGGKRRQGIGQQVLRGAIDFAWSNGAEAIEAYPLDTTEKTAPVFTYPGLRSMFEKEGFTKVADTESVIGGARRVVMRLESS
ncbi:MAG: GNAT family N-acetyltransferase [Brevibacterium aurantiacum]|uniref:GNAT family N-acetyltransferase n=1 Tax=Brevibacterium aurantiacum TaxID=273384 RepID=UPI003F8FE2D2